MAEDNKTDPANNDSVEASSSLPQTGAASKGAARQSQVPPVNPPLVKRTKRVEVIVDNLGPKLLKKGTVTDDEELVALLETARGRKLVREVK